MKNNIVSPPQAGSREIAGQEDAALVCGMAEQALDDAALINESGLTELEAQAFMNLAMSEVN